MKLEPLAGGEFEELTESPVVELCELEDDEGVELPAAGFFGGASRVVKLPSGFCDGGEVREMLVNDFQCSEFIEDESDSEELDERTVWGGPKDSVGSCFGLPDHPGPAAEGEQ